MVQQFPPATAHLAGYDRANFLWVPVLLDPDGFVYPAYLIPQRDAPAADTAAVITIAAVANQRHYLGYVHFHYSAAPAAGTITVEDGAGTTVWDRPVEALAAPVEIDFPQPLRGSVNTAMVITLPAGGGVIEGVLNIGYFTAPILILTS